MNRKKEEIVLSRDWGEYVGQSDMDHKLYNVTTIAYELIDYINLNPEVKIPKEIKYFTDMFEREIGDDVKQLNAWDDD